MDFTPTSRCRCCEGGPLRRVLDLGQQPLANSYTREFVVLPRYPLELVVCPACFHNQLGGSARPDLMFRDYLYVSGTSRTLREHFAALADEALGWLGRPAARVLDLACNDGTLLEAFRQKGCQVAGVDPARNLVDLASSKGLAIVEGYWPDAHGSVGGGFDLITATNVLAHVTDPGAFLKAALDALSPGGLVVLEFPYCREMILRREWDTIYHEHLSYFLAGPFRVLVDRVGARVAQARVVPIHGGSLRLAVRPGPGSHHPDFHELAEREGRDGLWDWPEYEAFAAHVDRVCDELSVLCTCLAAEGRRLIGYGASAKGNTLLNRCPLPLAYIVDDNPLKHGHMTPGQNIPIRPPSAAVREGPGLHVLLLAWNFAREIVDNLRTWRPGCGDRVVHYVPEVRCDAVDADLALLG